MVDISKQTAEKIRLENIFKPEIRTLFARIVRDFAVRFANTGIVRDAMTYQADWKTIIDRHYVRVQNRFMGVAVGKKSAESDKEKDDKELLLLALLTWRDENSVEQARIISETTSRNLNDAVRMAREEAVADGVVLSTRELAANAAAILKRKLAGRVDSIAMSETQSAAETTKFFEAEIDDGHEPSILRPATAVAVTTAKKTWRTVGDKRVRPIHRAVNGQTVPILEPFIVNGEKLMYPGDRSLGASVGNVANCRCSAIY